MRRLGLALLLLAACKEAPATVDTSPPPLGSQLFDRVGRPAVNSALIGIFAPRGEKDLVQERYNTTEPEGWGAHAQEIAKNLPLYDALDGVCGNQFLAGDSPDPGRYDALAGALADDRLYLNTGASSCGQYLAVELDATQVAPNQDCGGRDPRYDVIDVTYSALAVGSVSGVSDGVGADPEPLLDEFPFFAR